MCCQTMSEYYLSWPDILAVHPLSDIFMVCIYADLQNIFLPCVCDTAVPQKEMLLLRIGKLLAKK